MQYNNNNKKIIIINKATCWNKINRSWTSHKTTNIEYFSHIDFKMCLHNSIETELSVDNE